MLFQKIFGLLSCSLVVIGSSFFTAQDTASSAGTSGTSIVNVSVTDQKHQPVTGLQAENFLVSQDGQPLPIVSASANLPACVGLIVDHSGSMRQKLPAVDIAMEELVRAGNPVNRIFVANFNDNVYLDQDFTSDAHLIESAIEFRPAHGGTALFDAIAGAARHLAQTRDCKRNVLIVVSDGDDNESRIKLEQLQSVIQKAGNPAIYAIASPESNSTLAGRARRALNALTDATGGEAVFDNDIRKSSLRVAEELRSTYSLSYTPGHPPSGNFNVKIEVHAPASNDLSVRTNIPMPVDAAALAAPTVSAAPSSVASPAHSMPAGLPPSSVNSPAPTNCVGGSVVDEHNHPVAGITVQAEPVSNTYVYAHVPYPTTVTDEHGKFKLTVLEPGSYILVTANPSAGYPATIKQFYRNHEIELAEASKNCGNTHVRVGPKTATLKINAVDAVSGAQIAHFGITVENEAHASVVVADAAPGQPVPVPPGAKLKVSVWSRGYARSRPITVKSPVPESSEEVTVPLDPRN